MSAPLAQTAQRDPLDLAALELSSLHDIRPGVAVRIEAWTGIQRMTAWLDKACGICASADARIAKPAEWLLDNAHQVRRAIRLIEKDLSPAFYRRLPALARTEDAGLPRTFALAHGLLAASHMQMSLGLAVRFVNVYQEQTALTIAELWAFPVMLRLGCIELLAGAFSRLEPSLESPFALSSAAARPHFLEDTECVARAIANLAILAKIPWKSFFEQTSRVDAILRTDPNGVYARMDLETRDRYRQAVEELARGSGRTEWDIAADAVGRAKAAKPGWPFDIVGYWLIGEGRREIEAALGYRPLARLRWQRRLEDHAGPFYAGGAIIVSLLALALPVLSLAASGATPALWLLGALVSIVPASIFGFLAVNCAVTQLLPPRLLPKMDFDERIPPEHAPAVAVPVIIGGMGDVPGLMAKLEAHRVACPDPALDFVLLSDFPDAPDEHMPDDKALTDALMAGIARLNARYRRKDGGPFHLLHRPRHYNAAERLWMGWERKRGKLEQFAAMLATGDTAAFPVVAGNIERLRRHRMVVTVDADTILPRGSVNRLAAVMAHPLNRPVFDPATGKVLRGYGIVQPRVEIAPESGNASIFSRLFSGDTAIDIYSRAVSNVYQDLFGAGIFAGKGIFDAVAFHRALEGRIPENRLLSHDLFEGGHARAALVSDIVLYENFPSAYPEHMRRWHRWVRGDWQLLPWLLPWVKGRDGKLQRNALPRLARWQIIDNLRRSLIPPAMIIFAFTGWLALPVNALTWTLLTIAAPGSYLLTDLMTGLRLGPRKNAMRATARRLKDGGGYWLMSVVFLAHDAAIAADAILRTLVRRFITGRKLLEWTSAHAVAAHFSDRNGRADIWRSMWASPALALIGGAAILILRPGVFPFSAPLLFLWFSAPEAAFRTGQPRRPADDAPHAGDIPFLRMIARRTWLFFETFAGPDDHWLAPDNFQEDPHTEIARRTSPTNIGMMVLSTAAAWDLGHIGTIDFASRMRLCLDSLERMQRYRGHFYNWYDTRNLEPLEPRYVSSVDSGNLAVALIALRQTCADVAASGVQRPMLWQGLIDTVALLVEAARQASDGETAGLEAEADAVASACRKAMADAAHWYEALCDIENWHWPALERAVAAVVAMARTAHPDALRDIHIWIGRVQHHLVAMRRSAERLSPWLVLLIQAPAGFTIAAARIGGLLSSTIALKDCGEACERALLLLDDLRCENEAAMLWKQKLAGAIASGARRRKELCQTLSRIAARADALADAMDFRLLYDEQQKLFHIGYNASGHHLDPNHYDLLATEARLASLFAIAKGDVPYEHWFHLGRPTAKVDEGLVLVSWNGSMFEYLMPALLMKTYPETLLGASEGMAVDSQVRYGAALGVPWGISESGFAARNPDHHYRYHAFGVPELGLRRGLARDVVIAPYATMLGLQVRAGESVRNLRVLQNLGLIGRYGFYEAADFSPERVAEGERYMIVRSFMAHHQGMALGALDNALNGGIMVKRFHSDKRIRAVELLLQERIPWEIPPEPARPEQAAMPVARKAAVAPPHAWPAPAADAFAQLHALGNGRMTALVSEAGGGVLMWRNQALTRWMADATLDGYGLWIYAQDMETGALWSAARQPAGVAAEASGVLFHPHMAEFHRRDNGIGLRLEAGIARGDDIEIRRLTVINESGRRRVLRFTSYAEVVLAPPLDDERHPAFSKLFVASEYIRGLNGLIFTRRPRDPHQPPPVLLHRVMGDDLGLRLTGFETDRAVFIGRAGTLRRPAGIVEGLKGTAGFTLDPVMALQAEIVLEPHQDRQIAFLTFAGGSRESVLELAERFAILPSLDWALQDALAETVREAQDLALPPDALPVLQMLASLLMQPHAAFSAAPAVIAHNRIGQPGLWGFGISGDLPILLLRASDPREVTILHLLLRGLLWWRRRGIHADLVIMRIGASGYEEPMREKLMALLRETGTQGLLGQKGGVHLVFSDQMSAGERGFLETAARVVLDEAGGPLGQQLSGISGYRRRLPHFEPARPEPEDEAVEPAARPGDLLFDNGYGGFAPDGKSYVIHLEPGAHTPAPWANVLANDRFGSIVTEAGLGFTWAVNSGENRLTPWANDPVADAPGEAVYLRDEETAAVWTPTPKPAGGGAVIQIRHGCGKTSYESRGRGLSQTLTVFVPPDESVKVVRLRLVNLTGRSRRITATYYAEWLIGALRSMARPNVVCGYDAGAKALFARNPWNPEFADGVAFLTTNLPVHDITTDRMEFLGREGDARSPEALKSWGLGGRLRPGSDPCAAMQVHLDIAAGGTAEAVFILGYGEDEVSALALARRWQDMDLAAYAEKETERFWDRQLGAVAVKTPDPAFDLMINRWLLYQSLSSRIMARSGYYQSSGAYGFRDQLQDVLAFLWSDPARTRAHILKCAAYQFEEGDVLHWWHPPAGRGVRTRCSDDLLWLPYAVVRYVEATGDTGILDEKAPFLRAPPLAPGEGDRYARYEQGDQPFTLLEHCTRALLHGLTAGAHGLPLIGDGDWNDGMNRVGHAGRGESVWLAWFIIVILQGFKGLCGRIGRPDVAAPFEGRIETYARAIGKEAWDGAWFRRAFDDDGRPLGASANDECRIDSIAQSWAALARAADPAHVRKALGSAAMELVQPESRLVRLLWPPFDRSPRDPGYIKSYPPGIRENGGQYSHAAAWLGLAFAEIGDTDAAFMIFDLLNPIHHARTPEEAARYRIEPYVIAGDVAAAPPHVGRGGWSWYTGAAAWVWRLGVEGILGLDLKDGHLAIRPRLPKAWGEAEIEIKGPGGGILALRVEDPDRLGSGNAEILLDGVAFSGKTIPLPADGARHEVRIRILPV